MPKYDEILKKLQKSANDRDAKTAKQKCPLKKKPAIYVAILRADTGEAVGNVNLDISKPTKQTAASNHDGEIKVDPAKTGSHGLKVMLTKEQEKQFAPPKPLSTVTTKGQTAVSFFVLQPLGKLIVEVKDKNTNKPVDGVRVQAGLLPEQTTAAGRANFDGVPAGNHRLTVMVANPLETRVEVFDGGNLSKTFEPGYPATWDSSLDYGETKTLTVLIARMYWIEFVLAEEETNKPIAKAQIHLKLPGGEKKVVSSDEVGFVRLAYPRDGQVEIEQIETEQAGVVTKAEGKTVQMKSN